MKNIYFLLILIGLLPALLFSQNTSKTVVKSPDKSTKRVYYVSDDNPEIKQGPYIEYFNNKKTMEGDYVDNERHGEWLFYTPKKKVEIEANYNNGKKSGKWVYYYLNTDIILSEIYYTDDKQDSLFSYYKSSRLKRAYRSFNDSSKIMNIYYEDGSPYEIYRVEKDKKWSFSKMFFQNGKIHRETTFYKGKPFNIISCHKENGEELNGGSLKDGTGEYISYYLPFDKPQSNLAFKSYRNLKDSLLNGLSRYVNILGKTTKRGRYSKNKKVGLWEYFDLYGDYDYERYYLPNKYINRGNLSIKEISHYQIDYSYYKLSKPVFPGNEFYREEKIKRGNYLNNKRSGEWSFFNKNGILLFEGAYDKGERVGKWIYYYPKTKKISTEIFYSRNKIDSSFSYYEKGQLKNEIKNFSDSTGVIKTYYQDGTLHENIPRKSNTINGIAQIFFSNGDLHRETDYAFSKPKTVLNCFDQKGHKIDGGDLKNGNGKFISYFLPKDNSGDTLIIRSIVSYDDAFLNGEAIYYWKNGKIHREGNYIKGKPSSLWIYNNKFGEYVQENDYSDSKQKFRYKSLRKNPRSLNDEIRPLFLQGNKSMWKFINKNMREFTKDIGENISGQIRLGFVLSKTGEILSVEVIQGMGAEYNEKAIEIIKFMPRWSTGIYNGVPVNVPFGIKLRLK